MTEQPPLLEPIYFDAAAVPSGMRFAAWRAALSTMEVWQGGGEPFAARASLWLLDPLVLVHASVDPVRYERSAAMIRQDLKDHVAIVVLIDGGFVGAYGGETVASRSGSLTFLDMRRPWWTDAERLEAFVLSMPRAFVMPHLEGADPHGMVVEGALATLLQGFLRATVAVLPATSRTYASAIAERIRDLLADALKGAAREASRTPVRRDALISRVRTHIDEHLADHLDARVLCSRLNVSRATLYRAFGDGGGGVTHLILRRRLAALAALLSDPLDERSIAELASSVGLHDRSHLAKAFKREYGCTPSEFRAGNHKRGEAPPMEDVPLMFERWTSHLD